MSQIDVKSVAYRLERYGSRNDITILNCETFPTRDDRSILKFCDSGVESHQVQHELQLNYTVFHRHTSLACDFSENWIFPGQKLVNYRTAGAFLTDKMPNWISVAATRFTVSTIGGIVFQVAMNISCFVLSMVLWVQELWCVVKLLCRVNVRGNVIQCSLIRFETCNYPMKFNIKQSQHLLNSMSLIKITILPLKIL